MTELLGVAAERLVVRGLRASADLRHSGEEDHDCRVDQGCGKGRSILEAAVWGDPPAA